MAVNTDCIVKSFNIFKNEAVGMSVILYLETIQPFSFNEGVESLNAGIIIRISGV